MFLCFYVFRGKSKRDRLSHVLRFSFPVPVAGPSAKALALSFAFTAENIKSLPLAFALVIKLRSTCRQVYERDSSKQAFPCCFGAKKDRGTRFSVLAAREMKREPKNERGGRGSVSSLPFFPTPSPFTRAIFCAVFNARSLTLETARKRLLPPGGGGHFRNLWVGMCRCDPGTLDLYQS